MLSIEYMGKGVRIRATDALHVQHNPLWPTWSSLVLFILRIALKISSTISSVESVLVSLGMICIVTGMAQGVNHSGPSAVVETDCFSSFCQQEFSAFFFLKSHPPTNKIYGLKYKLSCILNQSLGAC